jgi:hypothetical protein
LRQRGATADRGDQRNCAEGRNCGATRAFSDGHHALSKSAPADAQDRPPASMIRGRPGQSFAGYDTRKEPPGFGRFFSTRNQRHCNRIYSRPSEGSLPPGMPREANRPISGGCSNMSAKRQQ